MHASDRYLETNYQLDDVMLSMAQNGYPKHLHHGEVGKGLIDYPAIFQRLGALGYDGWVSIEDGINGMQEMKNSVDYLKKMRKQYF
jgi:sugar phosphate isomerase/epimerase